jgi:nucleotide-binding universal stress UspA family protein
MKIELKRICVCSDFSAPAERAFDYALTFARQFGAELHVLHVIEDIIPTVPEPGISMLPTQEIMAGLRKGSEEAMTKLLASRDIADVNLKSVIREGVPFREVEAYARENDIQLVVVGTHGRTGLSHLLLGSVAERVVRSAPCPVLTVHLHEREFVKD